MVLVKNLKFCLPFVLYKIHQKKVFDDVLVRKQAFLDNQNMDLKKHKIEIFAKRIAMNLVKKLKFSMFCVYQK